MVAFTESVSAGFPYSLLQFGSLAFGSIHEFVLLLPFLVSWINSSEIEMDITDNSLKEVAANETTGNAFATSVYNDEYRPINAFKLNKSSAKEYWASDNTSATPIFLWFQFNERQRINKIAFKEKYSVIGDNAYMVSR